MASESYEYRVIRRFPDEDNPADREAILLAPTEDRHRAMSIHAMESEDGDVELQVRSIGPWRRSALRLGGQMSIPPVIHADHTPATKAYMDAVEGAVAFPASPLGGEGASDA